MSLLSRLEALESAATGMQYQYPNHFVTYTVEYGEDEAAKREAAVAEFKATHPTTPRDEIGLIVLRIVESEDGRPKHPEWAAMREEMS
jgi:hypothetical protein